MRYTYDVDDAVLKFFATVSKRRREQLLRIFDQVAENPLQVGDTVQHDHTGRPCQVKRFGEWTVTYWSEHLIKRVHVLAVEHLRL